MIRVKSTASANSKAIGFSDVISISLAAMKNRFAKHSSHFPIFLMFMSFLLHAQIENKPVWQMQHSGLTASLRGIDAASDSLVWISGSTGKYAITKDGGDTWNPGSVPGADSLDFRDVQVFDENNAILLACGPGEKSRIYQTADGGKNWHLRFTNPHKDGFFCAMAFWDAQNGIAFSDPVAGKLLLIRTTDGGKTWTEVAPDELPGTIEGEYAFAASGTCVSVFGENKAWIATGGAVARVFTSVNRGQNWQVFDTKMRSGAPSQGIFSLAFRDGLNGVAVGGDYQQPEQPGNTVLRTTDGGKSWQSPAGAQQAGYQSCVRYLQNGEQTLLVAVGRAGCSFSTDDGLNWQPISETGFYTLDVFGNKAWAAGAYGRVATLNLTTLTD